MYGAGSICHLRLPGTVARADRKGLHDIFLVPVVGGIIEPPVRHEGSWVAEVLRRSVGAVVVNRNDGLGYENISDRGTPGHLTFWRGGRRCPYTLRNPVSANHSTTFPWHNSRKPIGKRRIDPQSLFYDSIQIPQLCLYVLKTYLSRCGEGTTNLVAQLLIHVSVAEDAIDGCCECDSSRLTAG